MPISKMQGSHMKIKNIKISQFVLALSVSTFLFVGNVFGAVKPLSVALFYASSPPVNELKAFDVVVVDPDGGLTPARYGTGPSQLFAYVSVGEAERDRPYFKQFEASWLIGENKAWKSKVVDVSNPAWQKFFLDQVIEPLWQAGYRGFFLDTMDSYQLAATKENLPQMEAGLAATVRSIRERHPEARLILNRGFEIFERVKDITFAVAAESLYQNFSPASGKYGVVPDSDREWLLSHLNEVKKSGVPVIAIDYVQPGKRELARQTAEKIKELGFTPWVTDKDLSSLGIGKVEVLPRVVLGLYDGAEGKGDAFFTNLQRYIVMPLNYMGYTVEMHDLTKSLPDGVLEGRYAGVVIWSYSDSSGESKNLKDWVKRRIDEGVPLVFLERFGIPLDSNLQRLLGLEIVPGARAVSPVRIVLKDSRFGFEQQPLPNSDTFVPLKLKKGSTLLSLASKNGLTSDVAAITPWGGYIYGPYVISQLLDDKTAWIVDPFRFFKDALRLPDMPVPDTTTENGVRLLLSHVDGDGFESKGEWPGARLAAEELRTNILEKYHLPTTISVITSIISPNGLYPDKSAHLEKIARSIFALSNVEGASHSFSHPFRWKSDQIESGSEVEAMHGLKVKDYDFNLEAEINGSLNYINEKLMPPGKKARMFLWTGNCVPGEDAVSLSYKAGVLNINGGDTVITNSNRTLTDVAPLGIARGDWFQVFAPNQNENVYTSLWTEKFYGYRRVLETFDLTNLPRRLKPVNIYYHYYSATKEASLKALKQVHDWASGQRLFGIYTSDYAEKVLDFNRTVIARDGQGWLVRNSGKLRELRLPSNLGYPDLENSFNLAGFNDHGESRYLHLKSGGEARVNLHDSAPVSPYLKSAGGYLDLMERYGQNLKLSFTSHTPFTVVLGNTSGCRFANGIKPSGKSSANELTVDLTEGKHALAIHCP
jgi:polysaccharide biosynthesis protein PelA